MTTHSNLIKISHKDKTFLTPKPKNMTELEATFLKRFNISKNPDLDFVMFDGQDDIFIETDQDLANLYRYNPNPLTLTLKSQEQPPIPQTPSSLQPGDIDVFACFLSNSIPAEVDFVDELSKKEKMPCKHCFFNKGDPDLSLELDADFNCEVCKDERSMPTNKCWSLIGRLVEGRLKNIIIDPLSDFIKGREKTPPDLVEKKNGSFNGETRTNMTRNSFNTTFKSFVKEKTIGQNRRETANLSVCLIVLYQHFREDSS